MSQSATRLAGGRAGERAGLLEAEEELATLVRSLCAGRLNLNRKEAPKQRPSSQPDSLLNENLLSKQRLGQDLESWRSWDSVVLQLQTLVISKWCHFLGAVFPFSQLWSYRRQGSGGVLKIKDSC